MKRLFSATLIGAILGLMATVGIYGVLAQAPGVNSPWQPVWAIPIDSIKRTYVQSISSLSAAAPATDIFQLCGGSGVVTRVTKVTVGGRATAVTSGDVYLIKRSTAATGGTAFQLSGTVGVPYDSSISAGVSTATAYSANPTVGTLVGVIARAQINLSNLTTGVGTPTYVFDFGQRGSAVVLRGAAQCLTVNLSSQSFAGNLWSITTEWTEE